jgi:hypothetical protein
MKHRLERERKRRRVLADADRQQGDPRAAGGADHRLRGRCPSIQRQRRELTLARDRQQERPVGGRLPPVADGS